MSATIQLFTNYFSAQGMGAEQAASAASWFDSSMLESGTVVETLIDDLPSDFYSSNDPAPLDFVRNFQLIEGELRSNGNPVDKLRIVTQRSRALIEAEFLAGWLGLPPIMAASQPFGSVAALGAALYAGRSAASALRDDSLEASGDGPADPVDDADASGHKDMKFLSDEHFRIQGKITRVRAEMSKIDKSEVLKRIRAKVEADGVPVSERGREVFSRYRIDSEMKQHNALQRELDGLLSRLVEVSNSVVRALPVISKTELKSWHIYRGTLLRRVAFQFSPAGEINITNAGIGAKHNGFADFTSLERPEDAFLYARNGVDNDIAQGSDRTDQVIIEVPYDAVRQVARPDYDDPEHPYNFIPVDALDGLAGVKIYRLIPNLTDLIDADDAKFTAAVEKMRGFSEDEALDIAEQLGRMADEIARRHAERLSAPDVDAEAVISVRQDLEKAYQRWNAVTEIIEPSIRHRIWSALRSSAGQPLSNLMESLSLLDEKIRLNGFDSDGARKWLERASRTVDTLKHPVLGGRGYNVTGSRRELAFSVLAAVGFFKAEKRWDDDDIVFSAPAGSKINGSLMGIEATSWSEDVPNDFALKTYLRVLGWTMKVTPAADDTYEVRINFGKSLL